MSLSPAIAERVARLLPRLASESEGEVVATVAAIRRVLSKEGLSLHDLAEVVAARGGASGASEPEPAGEPGPARGAAQAAPEAPSDARRVRELAEACLARLGDLSAWERDFLTKVRGWSRSRNFHLSERQRARLRDIVRGVLGEAAHV